MEIKSGIGKTWRIFKGVTKLLMGVFFLLIGLGLGIGSVMLGIMGIIGVGIALVFAMMGMLCLMWGMKISEDREDSVYKHLKGIIKARYSR